MIRSAAIAIACNPDEQKRLIVIAEHSTGNPARREAMGRAARQRVLDHFSWSAIAAQTLGFYRDLLG